MRFTRFELFGSIDPNFGLAFVHLDATSDLDRLPFGPGKRVGDLFASDAGGIQLV